jgi:cation diffusion facilitator family transporter
MKYIFDGDSACAPCKLYNFTRVKGFQVNIKTKTARLSIASNTILIIIKIVAGILSGSVSILSEAIHSGIDLVAAIIAFVSVKLSAQPPDKNHPYDHGKYENVSGVIEAFLIFIAAGWIIYEAVSRIIEKRPIELLGVGIVVMAVSAIVNFFVSRRLYRIARQTDSIALEADALHLKTDVYTSAGVAIGIFLILITDWHYLDPVIAILVALLIIKESYELIMAAYRPLIDARLADEDIDIIESLLQNYKERGFSFHRIRTRKSGSHKYLDFHLEVPEHLSVGEAHTLCNEIERAIEEKIVNLDVNIHVEPFERFEKNKN